MDAIICGPMDLSASVGKMGNYFDPEVLGLMQTIIDKCKAHSKPFGLSIGLDMELIPVLDGPGRQLPVPGHAPRTTSAR